MKTLNIVIRGELHPVPADRPADLVLPDYNILIKNTTFEEGVVIWSNVNIYGAHIGAETRVGAFVEIRTGVSIGRRVKIEPFVFIPEGVTIEDGVFIGPHVTFTNDLFPRATDSDGRLKTEYAPVPTIIRRGASIGASSAIRCGAVVGEDAFVGMGAVVVDDVPPGTVVHGEKARRQRDV